MSTASPVAAKNYRAHPTALIETPHVGARTRIWAFAHLLPTCRVGEDCNICDHALVEDGAVIGDRVTVKCYVQVGDGITLEDDVFVGPNVGFTNDPYPRSRHWSAEYAKTLVQRGASIGANASILPGLTIGAGAMVGAGAVVTKNVPAHAIVVGNPAYVKGYVGEEGGKADPVLEELRLEKVQAPALPGRARLVRLQQTSDAAGARSAFSLEDLVPFSVARYELVHCVPARAVRGENAFRTVHQFLTPVNGGCTVRLFDGTRSGEVRLDRRDQALYIPPMTWASQFAFTPDAAILIFESSVGSEDAGDESADEIRESRDYLRMLNPGMLNPA